ncbi:MAG: zinc-binding dehydrogenase [Caldilineaceae bacterium]|nr:zinc-binding dehydrogenase [Caldilineaceae bacterium]
MSNTMAHHANPRVCFPGPQQVVLVEEQIAAQAGPGEMLVKCFYSLISAGTELAMYTHTHIGFSDPANTYAKYPFYPGYAAVGRVEAVGSGITDFAPGDVVYYPGHHQRYALIAPDKTTVLPVPQGMPLPHAPLIRMAEIAYTSVLMSSVRAGDTVAVLGLGLVGHLAAQLFQLQGAAVTGVDVVAFRRELASQSGIRPVVDAANQDAVAAVRDVTGGNGAAIVVEATGVPQLVETALEMAREQGEVILLGSTRGPAQVDVYNHIHRRGVTLKGAHGRLVPRHAPPGEIDQVDVDKQMLAWLYEGRLKVDHLLTERVCPEQGEVQRAYESLLHAKDKTMAILIDWS